MTNRDPAFARPLAEQTGLGAIDIRAVDTIRVPAADAVQKAVNGHPGTATSLAPLAYLPFQQVLRHNPDDDQWLGAGPVRALRTARVDGNVSRLDVLATPEALELKGKAAVREQAVPRHRHTGS